MKFYKIIFFFFASLYANAQSFQTDGSTTVNKRKIVSVGARAGLISSGFTHNGGLSMPSISSKSSLNWHAGITSDFAISKNYGTRIELNYLSKGAREQFVNDKIAIDSRNTLSYLQLHVLPVILKTKIGNTTPYIALGAYYARRLKISSKWKPGTSWETDEETPKIMNQKSDFGYSISLGIRTKHWPHAEIRYEAGLESVSSASLVRNRSLILAISI